MKKRLKIVHILLSTGFAGSERSTAESCNAQCEEHDVLLIIRSKQAKKNGAGILKHIDERVESRQVHPQFFTRKSIQSILDEWQPDIAHAHLRRATRMLARCNTSAAKVSTLHIGVNGPHFMQMDALVAISPWQLEHIPDNYNGKVQWIRNSLVPHHKPTDEHIQQLRQEFGAKTNTFVVGGVGRLSRSKGWDLLIQAFKNAELKDALLVLIGDGSEVKNLKEQAGEHPSIRFLGFKHNIKDYYSTFDIFVCPSREEPMGRVILEAMDAGVDVIASDIEGPRDILAEFPGYSFKSENAEELCSALQQAYKNREQSRKPVDLSAHHLQQVSREMIKLYENLLK